MRMTDPVVFEKVEYGDKEKKKKRRSGRRSKQTASTSATEMRVEASESVENGAATNYVLTSIKKNEPEICPSDESGSTTKLHDGSSSDLSAPHVNGRTSLEDRQSSQSQNSHSSDPDGKLVSKSGSMTISCQGSSNSSMSNDLSSLLRIKGYALKQFFFPHWSSESVSDALERGKVFKAYFRVNAYNRLEAYCHIDGVSTDVLISGIPAQNRAVEGDIVVVKVDPLSLWTRMRGSTMSYNNSVQVEDSKLLSKCCDMSSTSCKGKNKIDVHYDHTNDGSCLISGKEPHSERVTSLDAQAEPRGLSKYDHDGCSLASLDSSYVGSSSGLNDATNALRQLCAMISSFPSTRPTGKVVAIIERSPRRDAVVGFLNFNKSVRYQELCRKDATKNKGSIAFSDNEFIQLTPNDPRLPTMMVRVLSMPDCIRKRLKNGDKTLETELIAARIDNWSEESLVPQACISHTFGQGGEIESQISAILFEHAICFDEFSPESLACLPHLPWEIPHEELQIRRDLRNSCIFTIDPSTATDLDDALSVERLSSNIFRVGIHISDVSYFVLPDTELDKEAQIRSTSVYMLRKKIPMLPTLLSENVGSLNAGVDRLAFSVFLDINLSGDVVDRSIGRTVIRSCCKLSYEQAQEIIDETMSTGSRITSGNNWPSLHGDFEWLDVVNSVKDLHAISKILREKRFSDGALVLESSKISFLFDDYGDPYDSILSEQKNSNFLVEEFMLLANRTAAEIISRAFPESALLRRHPEPNSRKLREFEGFCNRHGLELDTSSSGQFHLSLQMIGEKLKDDSFLFDILLNYASKPMQLATYFCTGDFEDNEDDWGHYSLAVPQYTHFTSPLRRYPDIIVHRTLAAVLEAEEMYLLRLKTPNNFHEGQDNMRKCFTGVNFEKDAAESREGCQALSAAAIKHRVPGAESLTGIATHCNDRKLASGRVSDACNKLYMWALLRRKKDLFSEARVLSLGPRFMSIYIQKFAIERRIYYDEVEGLITEWLEATSTLVLNFHPNRRSHRRGNPGKWKTLEDVALVVSPCELHAELGVGSSDSSKSIDSSVEDLVVTSNSSSENELEPTVFPLTLRVLSTIPVTLHAIGGDDGPVDIGARLYMSSYFC